MNRAVATLVAVAGVAAATGCKPTGAHDDGGTTPDGGVDAQVVEQICTPAAGDTFCPGYAMAFCTAHLACCTDPTARYDTMDRCLARTTCLCTSHRQGSAPTAGHVVFDSAAGDALLARLHAATPSCPIADPASLEVDAAFHGTLAEGADCSPAASDYSALYACGPGLECYVTDFGDAMNPPRADCRRLRAAGETCDATAHCGPGLYCGDGPTIDAPGACRAKLAPGAACSFDFECTSDVCDATASTCTAPTADDTYCVDASSAI